MNDRKPPPRDLPFIQWLRKVNSERGTVVFWMGVGGLVLFSALNEPAYAALFGGLIPVSLVIGKDKDPP